MKKYVFELLKFFCAAILCTILSAFTSPSHANCNLFDPSTAELGDISSETGGISSSVQYRIVSGFIPVTPGETYTASGKMYNTDAGLNNVRIIRAHYDSGQRFIADSRTMSDATFTIPSGVSYVRVEYWTDNNGTAVIAQSQLQFEQGSTATAYVPYNPLCATCKNGVSPNLFETVDTTSGLYGVTLTSAANGLVTVVGTATGGGGRNTARLQNFTLPAGTYTVSFSGTKRSQLYLVAGNDSNATNLITDVNGGTFTISESKTLHFGLNLNNGTTYNDSFYIQLEAGSTATPYQPYGCIEPITIATTKYNETKFSPLNTALQNAISVVDTVVSNTITQAASIATLQTQKQTRPNDIADDSEKCPAGKKCLLVEDASGIPHWYEIVENAWDLPVGYTQLQYIRFDGSQYIITNYIMDQTSNPKVELKIKNKQGAAFGSQVENNRSILDYSSQLYCGAGTKRLTYVLPNDDNIHILSGEYNTNTTVLSVYVDGVLQKSGEQPGSFSTNKFAFGAINGGSDSSKLSGDVYSFKVYQNNSLVLNLIPAQRNSDSAIGMYDTVSSTFFENAGTGDFIAGPVAE